MMLLVPEMMIEAQERYEILRQIHAAQPVGRHLLTVQTELSDSIIRKHIEEMERTGLLVYRSSGISLTSKGESLLEPLSHYFRKSPFSDKMAASLQKILSMKKVILVRGDSDEKESVRGDIAQEAALALIRLIRDDDIVAVSGGALMAELAEMLPKLHMNVDVLPIRRGFGRRIDFLPNNVAAHMAEKLGGKYHILQIPDGLSPEFFYKLKKELPQINQTEELFSKAGILVTGIDSAEDIKKYHELPSDVTRRLEKENVSSEALGLYVNAEGKILYRLYNVGISRDDIPAIPHILITAGGSHNGEAILAVARAGIRGVLITDEGAGRKILQLVSGEKATTGGCKDHG